MSYRVFQYRLPMEGPPEDLNRYLTENRIVAVKQYVVTDAASPLLVFVVETIDLPKAVKSGEAKINYKEVPSAEDFAIYSKLRELRREVATREGVPVYAIFANSQLAAMAEGKVRTESDLGRIRGLGEARVKKYGEAFAAMIRQELEARENGAE